MSDDRPLKSAYELAMERLRRKDREHGKGEQRPLSDEQKQKIADARSRGRARLAELEIMHRKKLGEARGDPAKLGELEEGYRRDRERIERSVESEVARIRGR